MKPESSILPYDHLVNDAPREDGHRLARKVPIAQIVIAAVIIAVNIPAIDLYQKNWVDSLRADEVGIGFWAPAILILAAAVGLWAAKYAKWKYIWLVRTHRILSVLGTLAALSLLGVSISQLGAISTEYHRKMFINYDDDDDDDDYDYYNYHSYNTSTPSTTTTVDIGKKNRSIVLVTLYVVNLLMAAMTVVSSIINCRLSFGFLDLKTHKQIYSTATGNGAMMMAFEGCDVMVLDSNDRVVRGAQIIRVVPPEIDTEEHKQKLDESVVSSGRPVVQDV